MRKMSEKLKDSDKVGVVREVFKEDVAWVEIICDERKLKATVSGPDTKCNACLQHTLA